MRNLVIVLTAALFLSGCGTEKGSEIPPAGDKPTAASTGPTGRVRGVIRLQGNTPATAFEPITENQNVCGDRVNVSRLSLGKDKGVQRYRWKTSKKSKLKQRNDVLQLLSVFTNHHEVSRDGGGSQQFGSRSFKEGWWLTFEKL